MIKNGLILASFFLIATTSILSQNTFSSLYALNEGNVAPDLSWPSFENIEVSGNKLYIYGSKNIPVTDFVSNNTVHLFKLDGYGNLEVSKSLDSLFSNFDASFSVKNGEIVVSGDLHSGAIIQEDGEAVMVYDTLFDQLESYVIPKPNNENTQNNGVIFDNDNNIYHYFESKDSMDVISIRIAKISAQANSIDWQKKYNKPERINRITGLYLTPTGNLSFVNNWRNGAGAGNRGLSIVEITQEGTLVDSIEIERPSNYNGRIHYDEEGFVYFGHELIDITAHYNASGFLYKYDMEADSQVWYVYLPNDPLVNSRSHYINDIIGAPNGDVVICGSVFDHTEGSPTWNGFMARVTQAGEIVWYRVYKIPNPLPEEERFRDFRQSFLSRLTVNPNGGFYAVGNVRYHASALQTIPDSISYQEAWLLSVDENGNLEGEEQNEIIHIDGQNTNTPQYDIGTQWVYEVRPNGQFTSYQPLTFTIVDTQSINDTVAFVIESEPAGFHVTEWMYVNDAKVYFYNQTAGHFSLHYDYDTPTTYLTEYDFVGGGDEVGVASITIDSINSLTIPSGKVFDLQHLSIENSGTIEETYNTQVIGGIGANDFIRLYLGFGLNDFWTPIKLRCFLQNSISQPDSTVKFVDYPCDTNFLVSRLPKFTKSQSIELYPNPARSLVYLTNLPPMNGESLPYQLFNFTGQLINSGMLNMPELKVDQLPPGTYAIRVIVADQFYVGRFVVE